MTLSVMKYTEVILRNPEVDAEYRSSKGILLREKCSKRRRHAFEQLRSNIDVHRKHYRIDCINYFVHRETESHTL